MVLENPWTSACSRTPQELLQLRCSPVPCLPPLFSSRPRTNENVAEFTLLLRKTNSPPRAFLCQQPMATTLLTLRSNLQPQASAHRVLPFRQIPTFYQPRNLCHVASSGGHFSPCGNMKVAGITFCVGNLVLLANMNRNWH